MERDWEYPKIGEPVAFFTPDDPTPRKATFIRNDGLSTSWYEGTVPVFQDEHGVEWAGYEIWWVPWGVHEEALKGLQR